MDVRVPRPPPGPAMTARRYRATSQFRSLRSRVFSHAPGGSLCIRATVWRDMLAAAVTGGWSSTPVCTAAPHLALDKTVNANNRAVKRSPYYGLITPETWAPLDRHPLPRARTFLTTTSRSGRADPDTEPDRDAGSSENVGKHPEDGDAGRWSHSSPPIGTGMRSAAPPRDRPGATASPRSGKWVLTAVTLTTKLVLETYQ